MLLQEREVSVQHLVWLPRVVVACVAVHPGGRSVAKSGAQVSFSFSMAA